jgi:hypothetical protein
MVFCNGCNVVLTSYTAISIKECHLDNMGDMGAERMMGIIIVLNKFSISVPYGDTLGDSYQCKGSFRIYKIWFLVKQFKFLVVVCSITINK